MVDSLMQSSFVIYLSYSVKCFRFVLTVACTIQARLKKPAKIFKPGKARMKKSIDCYSLCVAGAPQLAFCISSS